MNTENQNAPGSFRAAALTLPVFLAGILPILMGCQPKEAPIERLYDSPYPPAYSLAVAPFRNLSGSNSLDVMTVTDEFYAELKLVRGDMQVYPVNRVLATMTELGLDNINTAEKVMMLAENLGVDAMIVGSITRYDPYPPPQMGMDLQMFIRAEQKENTWLRTVNPGDISRRGTNFAMPASMPLRPQAMVSRMFDAGRSEVVERIKKYARNRGQSDTPLGWKKCTTSRNYLRFVCHEMIGELLAREEIRVAAVVSAPAQGPSPNQGSGE